MKYIVSRTNGKPTDPDVYKDADSLTKFMMTSMGFLAETLSSQFSS